MSTAPSLPHPSVRGNPSVRGAHPSRVPASASRRSLLISVATTAPLLLLLALSGCAATHSKPLFKSPPPRYTAATNQEVGRVLRYDPGAATALVEISPLATPPADLAGRELIARNPDTLIPSARLVASPHRQNRVLGAYVTQGSPAISDEVVLPPLPAESAAPVATTPITPTAPSVPKK